ncbi:MAG TPA: thioredoxin domain-containing protein, partial [Geobacteraceae bacterium]
VDLLGREDGERFCRLFGVTGEGNFEGRSILYLAAPPDDWAQREGLAPDVATALVKSWRERLFSARSRRIRPFRDGKVVTAWNGLMVAALAKGCAATGRTAWLDAATLAVRAIEGGLTARDGRLLRSRHGGTASGPAFLEDYAALVTGLIELHAATGDRTYLDRAASLGGEMLRLFGASTGALYDVGNDAEQLPVRMVGGSDGVIPAANGLAAVGLFRLADLTGDDAFRERAAAIVGAFAAKMERQPAGYLTLIRAAEMLREQK